MTASTFDALKFNVELRDKTDNYVEELLAKTSRIDIADAAWKQAVRDYPDRIILIRDRAVVLRDSQRPEHPGQGVRAATFEQILGCMFAAAAMVIAIALLV